ncbi:MAG: hypothetical protein BHW37_06755 [Firmicutes bacterium CAG:272_52_7]|nr:MAG: hypothetical protein BHW37_06755 [Firmicutes bacterium CAG:272_52_7]
MKQFSYKDYPMRLFGAPLAGTETPFFRLPEEIRSSVRETLSGLGRRCPGARIGFRTDSRKFGVKVVLEQVNFDIGMSVFEAQSAEVLVGDRRSPYYCGFCCPPDYSTTEFSGEFTKSGDMEDVLILLPRNETVKDIVITTEDGAEVEPPTPYDGKPVIFYGSSITEGGCAAMMNSYNSIVSNRLNIDYYNFGFSGNCRGDLILADYFAGIDTSLFVYDYDHNADSEEMLAATHEQFYKRYREVFQFGTFRRTELGWQVSDGKVTLAGGFHRLVNAAPGYERLRVKGLKQETDYRVTSLAQAIRVGQFGNLLKHVAPVNVNPNGALLRIADRHITLPGRLFVLFHCREPACGLVEMVIDVVVVDL